MSIHRPIVRVALLVGAVTLCWILGSPAGAGPDEPSHLVRSAALIRGNTDGVLSGTMSVGPVLPAWMAVPDPSCYAFQPYQPASCAAGAPVPSGTAPFVTTATAYPVWGHLTYGPGTLLPDAVGWWATRISGAVLPVLLLGWALASAQRGNGALGAAGVLLALTPMAWFTIGIVNPSALAIAGGVALSVGLLRLSGGANTGWLAACGWVAMALPRRDGLVWAGAILLIVVILADRAGALTPRRFSRAQLGVMTGSTVLAVTTGVFSRAEASSTVVVPPVLTVLLLVLWSQRRRWDLARSSLIAAGVAATLLAVGAAWWIVDRQADGRLNSTLIVRIVSATGENLIEAIGVLGWLDAPVPTAFVMLWCIGFGVLCAASLVMADRRRLTMASMAIAVSILAAYVIEASQGIENNWQGRYFLPLLVLAPIVLGDIRLVVDLERRFAGFVAVVATIVLNAAFIAALRRWAVGLDGTFNAFRWDTFDSPLPPIALIVLHLLATLLLLRWAMTEVTAGDAESARVTGEASDELAEALGEWDPVE